MLLRKTVWFWKSGLAVISFVLMFSISGCSDTPPEEDTVSETVIDVQDVSEEEQENEEEIINICIDLYDKAAEENKLDDLEIIRSIVNRLGENEYPAVDSRNQVNMTEAEQVLEFCEKVDAQEEADITILEVGYLGGFVKYDLHTKDGNVDVVRSYYGYENGEIQKEVTGRYQAEYWNYTEEGYLMFSGVWFSEELYVLTLSGAEEHTALRVQPLDETYRELSRKYLLPISFEQNNMFIVDWSEEDFGDLNFYDMYDILYPKVNGQYVPYVADDNLSVSAVYRIPKEEFESVIMKYFNIDSETLQSKTVYDSENSTYEYKPRGFEEVEYPEYPYSEVIGYTENSDGNIQKIVRFNRKEAQDLAAKAKKACLSEAGLIRLLIRGYEPKEKPDDRFYDVMRELSSIGNNINQLAAKANTLGFIDAPMLKNEAAKWNKFQSEIERTYLRPNQSEMKWQ